MTPLLSKLVIAGLVLTVSAQQTTTSHTGSIPTTLATLVQPPGASSTAFLLETPASTAVRVVTGSQPPLSTTSSNPTQGPTSVDLSLLTIPSDTNTDSDSGYTDLDMDIGTGNQNHGVSTSSAVHYYLIFIAVFVCMIAVGVWLLYRRRRQKKARIEPGTRDALAHEISRAWRGHGQERPPLQGRTNSSRRRWMQRGAPWHNRATAETLPSTREEGLNELGEAPPAYVKETAFDSSPSISVSSLRSLSPDAYSRPVQPTDMVRGPTPTIPLRTLSRDGRDRPVATSIHTNEKPPDYDTATSAVNTPTLPSHATFAPR